MDKNYIRIICLEFKNIKNVPYGKVDFPIEEDIEHNGRNNAFGIYGPNGSGKTALINMLSILRCIVLGINPNSLSLAKYINNVNNEAFLSCSFVYFNSKSPLTFKYELKLKKELLNNIDKINIISENISYLGSRDKKEQKRFLSVDLLIKRNRLVRASITKTSSMIRMLMKAFLHRNLIHLLLYFLNI